MEIPATQRSGDYYLARTQMLDAMDKSEEALSALQQALDRTPARASLYHDACLFLIKRQRANEAVQLMDKASKALPEDRNILLVQAAVFAAARKGDEAERVLKRIENQWPEWAPPYVTYGILLEGLSRSDEAKSQLETAVALGASSGQLYYYLARSTLNAAPDRIDDAVKAIDRAVALSPGDAFVQSLAGRIAFQKHDYDAAVQHLEEAIRLRPDFLQTRYALTQAYKAAGRNQDAEHQTEEIQRLRAQNQLIDEQDAEGEWPIH
jgi:tetratricopeptide (TPR) repeat protein